jgi:hypothetical protein
MGAVHMPAPEHRNDTAAIGCQGCTGADSFARTYRIEAPGAGEVGPSSPIGAITPGKALPYCIRLP